MRLYESDRLKFANDAGAKIVTINHCAAFFCRAPCTDYYALAITARARHAEHIGLGVVSGIVATVAGKKLSPMVSQEIDRPDARNGAKRSYDSNAYTGGAGNRKAGFGRSTETALRGLWVLPAGAVGHAARPSQNEHGMPYARSNSIALDSDGARTPRAKSLA